MTNLRDVISHCRGVIRNHPFLIDKFLKVEEPADPGNRTEEEMTTEKTTTEEAYIQTAFLSGLKQFRYEVLLKNMHNAFHMG